MQRQVSTSNQSAYQYLLSFFTKEDMLNFRLTSRKCRDITKLGQKGVYQNKASFVMATTGQFDTEESNIEDSWELYQSIFTADKTHLAYIYKLRPQTGPNTSALETSYELKNAGCVYDPKIHFWEMNLVWLLGNIHSGRSFVICSDVSAEHMLRTDINITNLRKKNATRTYSAFAKEMAAILKSGYVPQRLANGECHLVPPQDIDLSALLLEEIKCTNEEVVSYYDSLRAFIGLNELVFPENISSDTDDSGSYDELYQDDSFEDDTDALSSPLVHYSQTNLGLFADSDDPIEPRQSLAKKARTLL
jgi:hypothetical protein